MEGHFNLKFIHRLKLQLSNKHLEKTMFTFHFQLIFPEVDDIIFVCHTLLKLLIKLGARYNKLIILFLVPMSSYKCKFNSSLSQHTFNCKRANKNRKIPSCNKLNSHKGMIHIRNSKYILNTPTLSFITIIRPTYMFFFYFLH